MSEINVRPEDSRCAEFVRPLEKTRVQIRLITRSRDRWLEFINQTISGLQLTQSRALIGLVIPTRPASSVSVLE